MSRGEKLFSQLVTFDFVFEIFAFSVIEEKKSRLREVTVLF